MNRAVAVRKAFSDGEATNSSNKKSGYPAMRYSFSVVILAFLSVSCGHEPTPVAPSEQDTTRTTAYSREDREIARKLSVTPEEKLTSEDPFFDLVSCQVSLETLERIADGIGNFSDEQVTALHKSQIFYKNRALSSPSEGRDISDVRERVELTYPDDGSRIRIAMACLRDLI